MFKKGKERKVKRNVEQKGHLKNKGERKEGSRKGNEGRRKCKSTIKEMEFRI